MLQTVNQADLEGRHKYMIILTGNDKLHISERSTGQICQDKYLTAERTHIQVLIITLYNNNV